MKFIIKNKECTTYCINCNKEFIFSTAGKVLHEGRPLLGDPIKYPNLVCYECQIQYYLIIRYPEDISVNRVVYNFEKPKGASEIVQIVCDYYINLNRVSVSYNNDFFNKEIMPFKSPDPPVSTEMILRKILTYMVFK